MAAPLILIGAGTILQMGGQLAANMDSARQERQNAKFYDEQAKYARLSAMRAQAIAEFDYSTKVGAQTSGYASSGVDISGSAAITIGGTLRNAADEIWAIKKKGDLDTRLARMRLQQSDERAEMLSSIGFNLVQAATTGINGYANFRQNELTNAGRETSAVASYKAPASSAGAGMLNSDFSYNSPTFGRIGGGS